MNLWAAAIVVFFLNIPFGYWRGNTRRFSLQWILAVHLPVPGVVALRILAGLGWQFVTFPVLAGAYFCGQAAGGRLRRLLGAGAR